MRVRKIHMEVTDSDNIAVAVHDRNGESGAFPPGPVIERHVDAVYIDGVGVSLSGSLHLDASNTDTTVEFRAGNSLKGEPDRELHIETDSSGGADATIAIQRL